MKVHEPKKVEIGGVTFYIWPFKAFVAANISGDLAGFLLPLVGALAPFIGTKGADGQEKSLLDVDAEAAAPAIADAFNALSGDRLEAMLKKLLIRQQNITMDHPETKETVRLTEDLADEVFCGEPQDMFILAFEVIRFNFNGFFSKLGSQFGGAVEKLKDLVGTSPATGSST